MIEGLSSWQIIAFWTSMSAVIAIFSLSILALTMAPFQFFPPPSKKSWQHRTFLLLFRLFFYPLVALSILVFVPTTGTKALVQFGLGGLLSGAGFGLAFWITFQLGWRNAFGEKTGLRTNGWFRFSRNPIYVATWIGLIGWGILVHHNLVTILLTLWGLMYVFAPIFEEPWLKERYGELYLNYKRSTPRFFWKI